MIVVCCGEPFQQQVPPSPFVPSLGLSFRHMLLLIHQFEEQFYLLQFSSLSISRGLLVVLCGHHLGNY